MEDLDFDKFLVDLDAELNGKSSSVSEEPAVRPAPTVESEEIPSINLEPAPTPVRSKESRPDELRRVRPAPEPVQYEEDDEDWEDARPRKKRPIGLLIFLLIVAILLAAALIVLTWMGRQNAVPAAAQPAETAVEETEPTAPPAAGAVVEAAEDNAEAESGTAQSYVIDTASGVFHTASCALVEDIEEGVSRYSDESRDKLVEQGFTACEVCKP